MMPCRRSLLPGSGAGLTVASHSAPAGEVTTTRSEWAIGKVLRS
jgi:hypothetical protein